MKIVCLSTSTPIRTQRAHAVKYDSTDEKEFLHRRMENGKKNAQILDGKEKAK